MTTIFEGSEFGSAIPFLEGARQPRARIHGRRSGRMWAFVQVRPRRANDRPRGTERLRSRRVGHVNRVLLAESFPREPPSQGGPMISSTMRTAPPEGGA